MNTAILVASSTLALILIVVLVREVRLRRALQRLLSRLLAYWKNPHGDNSPDRSRSPRPDRGDT